MARFDERTSEVAGVLEASDCDDLVKVFLAPLTFEYAAPPDAAGEPALTQAVPDDRNRIRSNIMPVIVRSSFD